MEDLQFSQVNKSQTGPVEPQEIKGTYLTDVWSEVEKEAGESKDIKAQALLLLRKEISNEIIKLREEGKKFRENLQDYQKSLKRTDNFLIGITVVIAIAFITILSLVFFDLIKEKDLYLRYNDLYQNYSETNSQLKDIIYEQKIEVNNLKNELEILKTKK